MQTLLNFLTNFVNLSLETPALSVCLVVLMAILLTALLLCKKFFSHKITSNAISSTCLRMLEKSLETLSKNSRKPQSTEQQNDKSSTDLELKLTQEQAQASQLIQQIKEVISNNEEH